MSPDSIRPETPDATDGSGRVDDLALRQQLRALPPSTPASDIEALNRRVLEQWRESHGPTKQRPGRSPVQAAGWGRRPWLVASTGLVVGLALVVGLWLQRSDPAMDDLLRPDVLSQMAVGEM